jgi:hypothetical protein
LEIEMENLALNGTRVGFEEKNYCEKQAAGSRSEETLKDATT